MIRSRSGRRRQPRPLEASQKPRGAFHPRVQKVGPQHLGIVRVDCAKARSKWMLADFFGNVLVPPTVVEHKRTALDETSQRLRQARCQHDLRDLLVAIERTGRYHQPVRHAFAAAGFETRIVHPFATSRLRQARDTGNKTDDADLVAIHTAAVHSFALVEQELHEKRTTFQLLIRHRRELVRKTVILQVQIREHLDAALPGFAACFNDFWDCDYALFRARRFPSAQALRQAGLDGLCQGLDNAGLRYQRRSLQPLLDWAEHAAAPDGAAAARLRFAAALDDDRWRSL